MRGFLELWIVWRILRESVAAKRYQTSRDADDRYSQSHEPLIDQQTIEGHSVRALYLTTAAADFGGEFLEVAKRLWDDAVDKKMYATGGLGSRPRVCDRLASLDSAVSFLSINTGYYDQNLRHTPRVHLQYRSFRFH